LVHCDRRHARSFIQKNGIRVLAFRDMKSENEKKGYYVFEIHEMLIGIQKFSLNLNRTNILQI
jgi:hypothetical protein